jgi:hypothetical protein
MHAYSFLCISQSDLAHGAMLSQESNKEAIARSMGKPVAYGTVIQLMHTSSGKFLTQVTGFSPASFLLNQNLFA